MHSCEPTRNTVKLARECLGLSREVRRMLGLQLRCKVHAYHAGIPRFDAQHHTHTLMHIHTLHAQSHEQVCKDTHIQKAPGRDTYM